MICRNSTSTLSQTEDYSRWAGASGLDLAHAVESGRLKNIDLHILEKNAGLGVTWYVESIPGCACDIPSHNYLVCLTSGSQLRRNWIHLYSTGNVSC